MTNHDALTRISDNQAINAAFVVSTNSIKIIGNLGLPLSLAGRDIGNSGKLTFRCHVTEAFSGGGIASLTVNIATAATEDLSVPTLLGATVVPLTGLVQGNEFDVRIPSLGELQAVGLNFIGLVYAPSAVPTFGRLSAWMALGDSPNRPRPLRANYTGPS